MSANMAASFAAILASSQKQKTPDLNQDGSDNKKTDYRGFCLAIHPEHGLLLLKCTRKQPVKPAHDQLPGGHVDAHEIDRYTSETNNRGQEALFLAARAGCARELYEETGVNLQSSLERFLPLVIRSDEANGGLCNEFKDRLFFVIEVSNDDFYSRTDSQDDTKLIPPEEGSSGRDLLLKISIEHSGFSFEKNPTQAIQRLEYHSGGKVSEALRKALEQTTS